MGVLVPVDSDDPRANVQIPINQDLDNSIINTDTVNAVLLCEDTSFGSSRTYELLAGAAIPWQHKTCFAILAAPTTGVRLWVTTVSYYFPGTINVFSVNTTSKSPTTGQFTPTGTAAVIAPARVDRTALTIHNLSTSGLVLHIGVDASVTDNTGFALEAGQTITLRSPIAWYGIDFGGLGGSVISWVDE